MITAGRDRIATALVLACVAAVAGCGSGDKSSSGANAPAGGEQGGGQARGEVSFASPRPGAQTGGTVHVKVRLHDFQIAPGAVGQAPRPGQGHLHFQMDGGRYDEPRYSGKNGLIARKLGVAGKYSPALAPVITYRRLPPGRHRLEVYLANNNHTNVGVDSEVRFSVK